MQNICIKAIVHHLHHFADIIAQIGKREYLQEECPRTREPILS